MAKVERPTVIVGNWKMHKTADEAVAFVQTLVPLVADVSCKIYLAVPFTLIRPVADATKDFGIMVGAQNMNDAGNGAFTGEVAAMMIKEAGARFVILGHSERRRIFNEDDAFINRKVKRALDEGIQPILCVGETLEARKADKTEEVLHTQIIAGLDGIEDLNSVMIAYEPVWAIGSGLAATPELAGNTHKLCRSIVQEKWGKSVADQMPLLYGGSVTPSNAKSLLNTSHIDGLLVGGASLSADAFGTIVKETL